MSNNQCRTCALPSNARIELENSWATGASYPFLSEQAAKLGFELPPRTLNNHFIAGHASVDRTLAPKAMDTPPGDQGPTASATMTYSGGEITTGPKKLAGDGPLDFDEILEEFGFDPKKYAVSPTGVRTSRWQSANGEWLVSYRIQVVLRESVQPLEEFEFDSLRRQAFDSVWERVRPEPAVPTNRTVFVCPSDRQIGKIGSRGDTKDTLIRIEEQREKLIPYLEDLAPSKVFYADAGDIVEGFENVASQKFLNDLSLMRQIEVAGSAVEGDLQAIHSVVPEITALTVPSNHSAWRSGKDYLGKPEDDWGIFIFRQVEKMLGYNDKYSSIGFQFPGEWEMSQSVTTPGGHKVGITHGDKTSLQKTPEWWAKQNAGGSVLSGVHVLITGHYHTPLTQVIGRTEEGLPVHWLVAPTSDNGSDWYRHISGYDSDPGLLVFAIDDESGLDFGTVSYL